MLNRIYLSFTIVLLFVFFATNSSAQQPLVDHPDLVAAKADTLLQQAVSFKEHVGLSGGIYANGKIIWAGGAGFRNSAEQSPADENMVHRIASISKPMTAVAIMQLVEKGMLELDIPIQKYVPEFPVKPEGDITVRQLLTHTSGIPHYNSFKDGFSLEQYPDLLSAMNRFKDRKLVGVPGTTYQYSTYGYGVLGVIIEKVSGMAYEAYMKKHVWEPAGMLCTSVEKAEQEVAQKSKLYNLTENGVLEEDLKTNLSMKTPGGGLQSSATDLLRFGEALFKHQLLKKESLQQMLVDPGIRPKEAGNSYAMGWFLYANDERGRIIGHSGSQAGTTTQLMILLDQKVVISLISNTRGNWGNIFNLSWQMIDLCLSEEARTKPLKKAIVMSNEKLDRFTGKYKFGKGNVLTIRREGNQLYSDLKQYKGLKLFPESDHKIFYRATPAHFEFELDDQGKVIKTTYVQEGKSYYPEKIK